MNARRWFWTLLLGALAWLLAGRFLAPYEAAGQGLVHPRPAPLLQRVQGDVSGIAGVIVTPLSLGARWVQMHIARLAAPRPAASATVEELQLDLRRLQNEVRMLQGHNEELAAILREKLLYTAIKPLSAQDILPAQVLASGSASGDVCRLDVGGAQGVKEGQVVMKDLSPVGRIERVEGATSIVRLTTAVGRKLRARLVRPSSEGDRPIIAECQLRGEGNGLLRCDTISSLVHVQQGDTMLLADKSWPLTVQNTLVGEVIEVQQTPDRRYNLKVKPGVDIARTGRVVVLLEK